MDLTLEELGNQHANKQAPLMAGISRKPRYARDGTSPGRPRTGLAAGPSHNGRLGAVLPRVPTDFSYRARFAWRIFRPADARANI